MFSAQTYSELTSAKMDADVNIYSVLVVLIHDSEFKGGLKQEYIFFLSHFNFAL